MSIFAALAPVAGSIIGGLMGGDDREEAAEAQLAGQREAIDADREKLALIRGDLQPFREGGGDAYARLLDVLLGRVDPGALVASMPGYAFERDQGMDAIRKLQSARGDLYSGNAGKELVEYGQGLASSRFQQYLDRLFNTGTVGANAAAQTASATIPMSQAISGRLADMGATRAGGIVGAGNARIQGLTGALTELGGQIQAGNLDWGDILGGVTRTPPIMPPARQGDMMSGPELY